MSKQVLFDYGFGERGFGTRIFLIDKFQKKKLIAFIPESDNKRRLFKTKIKNNGKDTSDK